MLKNLRKAYFYYSIRRLGLKKRHNAYCITSTMEKGGMTKKKAEIFKQLTLLIIPLSDKCLLNAFSKTFTKSINKYMNTRSFFKLTKCTK